MSEKFIIYIHTFKSTNKSYIGYTSLTIEKRLHKHILNCKAGFESKFYRAIKKYGVSDIESSILHECKSKEEAKEKEIEMIKNFDTFENGLNETIGGDGGWIVPDAKLERWKKTKSERMSGERNPTYSGVKDIEILEKAYDYFLKTNHMPVRKWQMFSSEEYDFPKSYSKFRFREYGSGLKGFKNAMKEIYSLNDNDFKYIITQEHISRLSNSTKGKHWYINIHTQQRRQCFEKDIDRKDWLTAHEIKGLKNGN
jgi:hypothetical protein